MKKTIGYLRSANDEHAFEITKKDMTAFAQHHNLGEVTWVEEIGSGISPWRTRKLAEILHQMQPDDNLIYLDTTRLSRDLNQVAEILSYAKEKNINIYSLE